MHYIALIGGGMLVVGCFLPWISLVTILVQRMLGAAFGAFALISALFAAGVAIHNIVKNQNRMKYAYLAIGVLCLMIGVYGLLQVRDIRTTAKFVDAPQQRMNARNDMEAAIGIMSTGLWFIAIGGLILVGTGLVNLSSLRLLASGISVSADGGLPTFGAGAQRAAILNGITGPYAGQQIPVPPEGIVIGRDPAYCSLVIQSPSVSRRHARIAQGPSPDTWTLEDLNSTNGTFVMERNSWVRLTAPVVLTIFKRFRLGDERTEFEIR